MSMRTRMIKNRITGFTLIEALIYVALLVIISVGAVTFLFSLEDLFQQHRSEQALFVAGTHTMERILAELRTGETVDLLSSVIASTTEGVLAIDNGSKVTTFDWEGDEIEVTVDGVSEGSLSGSTVAVEQFTVYHYPMAVGEMVRVKLTLSSTIGDYSATSTFYGGADIRGSYD